MGATAPIDFEKSLVAPINFDKKSNSTTDFDNFHEKLGVTKKLCIHRLGQFSCENVGYKETLHLSI